MTVKYGTILIPICVGALMACERGGSDWAGTITDSAGVAMVANPADGDWTLQPRPEIVEELDIGGEEGGAAYQFGIIVALDVDAAGRILVLDAQASEIRVFAADGRHVRSFGKRGGGPGELSPTAMALLAGANDVVYVADIGRQRIAAFGADGTEVGSTRVPLENGIPMRFDRSPQGRFVMQVRAMTLPGMRDTVPMRDRILLRDPASEQADTLLELESGRTFEFGAQAAPKIRLFSPEPVWAMLQDGGIAHGRNDAFRVEVRGADGVLQRVITRPVERRPVTEADRTAFKDLMKQSMERTLPNASPQAVAYVQQMLESTEFADNYPAFASLLGGPGGTLWVQRIRTAEDAQREGGTFDAEQVGSAQWDIFDADGRLLGMLELPQRFMPMRVVDATIYGKRKDELDIEHIVRLRVRGLTTEPVPAEGRR